MEFEIGEQYIVNDPTNVTNRNGSIIEITSAGSYRYGYKIIHSDQGTEDHNIWPSSRAFSSGSVFAKHLKPLSEPYIPEEINPEDHSDMLFN